MSILLGLTGGIGSGKTLISNFLIEMDVPVYIADNKAKTIMDKPEVVKAVQAIFDQNVITEKGFLDRSKIRTIVFDNNKLLTALNDVIHPLVKYDFEAWLEEHKCYPIVVKETALLFENKLEHDFNYIILVTAPDYVRIKRVVERDNVSENDVINIINNQLSDDKKAMKSHYVINNINKELVKKEIIAIVQDIKNKNNLV